MPRKPKFRPRITRVKLNPEQAVLQCYCYSTGYRNVPQVDSLGWAQACHPDPNGSWKIKYADWVQLHGASS